VNVIGARGEGQTGKIFLRQHSKCCIPGTVLRFGAPRYSATGIFQAESSVERRGALLKERLQRIGEPQGQIGRQRLMPAAKPGNRLNISNGLNHGFLPNIEVNNSKRSE